jgi:hypothetical protein
MGCALVIIPSLGRRHRHEPDLSASGCIKAIDPVETAIDALDKIPPDLADFLVRVAANETNADLLVDFLVAAKAGDRLSEA